MKNNKQVFEWIDTILIENKYNKVNVMDSIDSYIREMQDEAQSYEMQNGGTQDLEMSNKEIFQYALYQSSEKGIQYIFVLDVGKTEIGKMNLNIRQRDIYTRLLELGEKVELEFDKNVSLLLCVNDNISDERLEKEVLNIEEDPYCFKKLVFTYTEEETENLSSILGEENIWDYMQSCIDELQENKAEIDEERIKFVLRLFIKLPFLTINIVKKEKKADFLEDIGNQSERKYKSLWEDINNLNIQEIEDIKNYSEEDIDDLLNKWYMEEMK